MNAKNKWSSRWKWGWLALLLRLLRLGLGVQYFSLGWRVAGRVIETRRHVDTFTRFIDTPDNRELRLLCEIGHQIDIVRLACV